MIIIDYLIIKHTYLNMTFQIKSTRERADSSFRDILTFTKKIIENYYFAVLINFNVCSKELHFHTVNSLKSLKSEK